MNRFARLIQNSAGRLWSHTHYETPVPVPASMAFITSVRRQHRSVQRHIMDRAPYLIKHEDRRPSVVVYRLFFAILQSHFDNAKVLILNGTLWLAGAATTASSAESQEDGWPLALSSIIIMVLPS